MYYTATADWWYQIAKKIKIQESIIKHKKATDMEWTLFRSLSDIYVVKSLLSGASKGTLVGGEAKKYLEDTLAEGRKLKD